MLPGRIGGAHVEGVTALGQRREALRGRARVPHAAVEPALEARAGLGRAEREAGRRPWRASRWAASDRRGGRRVVRVPGRRRVVRRRRIGGRRGIPGPTARPPVIARPGVRVQAEEHLHAVAEAVAVVVGHPRGGLRDLHLVAVGQPVAVGVLPARRGLGALDLVAVREPVPVAVAFRRGEVFDPFTSKPSERPSRSVSFLRGLVCEPRSSYLSRSPSPSVSFLRGLVCDWRFSKRFVEPVAVGVRVGRARCGRTKHTRTSAGTRVPSAGGLNQRACMAAVARLCERPCPRDRDSALTGVLPIGALINLPVRARSGQGPASMSRRRGRTTHRARLVGGGLAEREAGQRWKLEGRVF